MTDIPTSSGLSSWNRPKAGRAVPASVGIWTVTTLLATALAACGHPNVEPRDPQATQFEPPKEAAASTVAAAGPAASAQIRPPAGSAVPVRIGPEEVRLAALPRVTQADFQYLGAFRVPGRGGATTSTFDYGGTALAFNPVRNSIYLIGHPWHNYSAELAVPTIRVAATIDQLDTASVLQPLTDPLEGKLPSINPRDPNSKSIPGQFIYKGRLYITGLSNYDGAGTQIASHFVRSPDLSIKGGVEGPFRIEGVSPRWVAGMMAEIPSDWQSAFGGPALAGIAGMSIVSSASNGPTATVFDPEELGRRPAAVGALVLGYPVATPLGGGTNRLGEVNAVWNLTSTVRGLVFPDGTRSVIFFGRHGIGAYCYGEGLPTPPPPGAPDCHDPADSSKGTHAFPYRYQAWAYDAMDLVRVRRGEIPSHTVKPYAIWQFELPFTIKNGPHALGGVAYDAQTRRLFISQGLADNTGYSRSPIIHVFSLSPAPQGG